MHISEYRASGNLGNLKSLKLSENLKVVLKSQGKSENSEKTVRAKE